MGVSFKIEGMDELTEKIEKLGNIPQKHVTSAVKKAMAIPYKQAVADAPKKTGSLEKGIIMIGEKSRTKAKKVNRIVFDRAMNAVFQKRNKLGKITGYYPVSQEYGWYTQTGKHVPGRKFIRKNLEINTDKIERTIIEEVGGKLEREIRKAELK